MPDPGQSAPELLIFMDWNPLLTKLARFKAIFGHTDVPYPWPEDPLLSEWVEASRQHRDALPGPLRVALEALDLKWDIPAQWPVFFEQLREYHWQTGNTRVTAKAGRGTVLRTWTEQQRQARVALTGTQVAQLDGLGFAWEQPDEKQARWDDMYGQLLAFREQYGHCRVPSSYTLNKPLAKWVARQREQGATMLPARKARLEALGFLWKEDLVALDEEAWHEKYEQLCAFHQTHGHFRVPAGEKQYRSLRIWVDHQRKGQQSLPPDRQRQLDGIGFPWGNDLVKQQEDAWQQMYGKLKAFQARFGHVRVPSKWKEDPALGAWVTRQRRRRNALPPAQRAQLDTLGFAWPEHISRSKQQRWLKSYRELKAFREQYGHCRVPDQYEANPALGKWVSWQRKQEREGKLPPGRKKLLAEIGFAWADTLQRESRLRWERMYLRLKRFYQKYGHSQVPEGWSHDAKLAIWVSMLRQHEKRLSDEQRARLNELAFPWKRTLRHEREKVWEQMFQKLLVFYREKGHCRVTLSHPDQKFFRWVAKQRRDRHKLPPHRLAKLDALGFSWKEDNQKLKEEKWESMYDQLVAFKERFGHSRVPDRWPENVKLANWVSHQRRKADKLPPTRREKLEQIGFF